MANYERSQSELEQFEFSSFERDFKNQSILEKIECDEVCDSLTFFVFSRYTFFIFFGTSKFFGGFECCFMSFFELFEIVLTNGVSNGRNSHSFILVVEMIIHSYDRNILLC